MYAYSLYWRKMYIYLHHRVLVLLRTSIHTTTARLGELIDQMNLTCFKNSQITLTSLRKSKSTSVLSQGLRHVLFPSIKVGGEEGLFLAILVLFHPWDI